MNPLLEKKKSELRAHCIPTKNGTEASDEEQARIEKLICEIELENACKDVESEAAGAWRVVYSTAPPPSNGKLGPLPFVGQAFQLINPKNKTYENVLKLRFLQLTLKARYEVLWDETPENNRWTVTFETISATFFERQEPSLTKEFPKNTTREWLTTFQDENFRIVRAGRTTKGINDNVFVMVRERPWWE